MHCSWGPENQSGRYDAAIHLDVRSGKVANLPAFLRHFTEARPLSVVVSRRFQSRASRAVQLAKKMAAPIVNGGWDVFSFYLYHVGGFNVVFKTSYTLDFIAALIRSPIYALHGLALRAIQCKVLFWSWFAKEAMLLMMTSLLLLPLVARQKHKWQTGRLEQGKYVTFSLKLVVRTSLPSKWIAALRYARFKVNNTAYGWQTVNIIWKHVYQQD